MGETPVNQASSRSHAIFTLKISSEKEERHTDAQSQEGSDAEMRTITSQSELNLVDLAGSERVYKTDRDR